MDEWVHLREQLDRRGVRGSEDLGRFVNDTSHFAASGFDERAAMPVFLEQLPRLTDRLVVMAVAGHLKRPWARPAAFAPLHDSFLQWAVKDPTVGWTLGDALANAARMQELPALLALASDARYGTARQMIVHSLSRFRRSPEVVPVLLDLVHDPDVGLHAMGALRRTVGPAEALPVLQEVLTLHPHDALGEAAGREVRKAEKAMRQVETRATPT